MCGGVTQWCFMKLASRKCEGNTEEVMEQEEKLCNDVEAVIEVTYLGGRLTLVEDMRLL